MFASKGKDIFIASYFILFALLLNLDSLTAQELEEVLVTTTRGSLDSTHSVNSVAQVDKERIQELQPAIITDALQGSPGVFIQQTTPGQGTAIVRGLKGSEILHLVDGMRLNNALFRNAPNQYLALVDPWIVERADIVRGPLSSLYGSDAMGGVVHLFTGRPDFSNEFSDDFYTWQSKARLSFDSSTNGQILNASTAFANEQFSTGLSFSYSDQGDLITANDVELSPTAYRSKAASYFVNYIDAFEREWDFSIQYLEQPKTPRFDELVPGFGQTQASSEQFLFKPNSRLFLHGVHRSSGYSLWLDELEMHLGMQIVTDGRRTQDTGSSFIRTEDNESELLGLTIQASTAPFEKHLINYGADFYYDTVSSARQQVNTQTQATETISSRFPDGSSLSSYDIYVHDQINFSERVNVDAGMRLSKTSTKLTETENSSTATISNTDLSGSFGVRYALTDNIDGIVNIARGFRAPNIFDLGTLGARPGNRFNIANVNLKPETVLSSEIGLRINKEKYTADLVFWTNDYKDKIISVFTGEQTDSLRDIVQSQNASSVKLLGAEISGEWKLSEKNSISNNLNYTYGETDVLNANKEPADRIPPLNGNIAWRYANTKWWLKSELMFAQNQDRLNSRDIRDPRINPLGTSGWGILNLAWGMDFSQNLKITTRFENILDKPYRRHGSGLDAAGRSFKVSLEAKY